MTTLELDGEVAELAPDPGAGDSRVFAVLSRPESVDAVCRLIGVSAAQGEARECSQAVDSCRGNLGEALGGRAAPALPGGDLEPVLGCPLTVAQLDGCIAGVLERGVAAYGAVGCDMPAPPAIDTLTLLASPECLVVALFCPELVASLAGGR